MSYRRLTPDEQHAREASRAAIAEAFAKRPRERLPIIAPTLEEMLAFERNHPGRHDGRREEGIAKTFGMNAIRYYQYLNRALDTPEALEADPHLVNRLRDRRDRATAIRATKDMRSYRRN